MTKPWLLAALLPMAFGPLAVKAQAADRARDLAATCAGCHGTDGRARGDMKPLAGRPADEIVTALADFRSGARPSTIMQQIARGYTEDQIRLLAGYFAAQAVQR